MPAGRHLDAGRTVAEEPKSPSFRIPEQLQAQLKKPDLPKQQSRSSDHPKTELQGEIQVK